MSTPPQSQSHQAQMPRGSNWDRSPAEADVYAHAVPQRDQTAFMMAEFTNTSGERILPAEQGSFYIDGTLIGIGYVEEIAAGETTSLAFGAIQGIQSLGLFWDRNEGDSGYISRSNERSEEVEIEVKNLTSEDWNVRLYDAVPFSEQEDLEITWQAMPRPTQTDDENRRGILRWDLDLDAADSEIIKVTTRIKWPDGKVLR